MALIYTMDVLVVVQADMGIVASCQGAALNEGFNLAPSLAFLCCCFFLKVCIVLLGAIVYAALMLLPVSVDANVGTLLRASPLGMLPLYTGS